MTVSTTELLDLTRSVVVEGADGCGKTELAFQRYLTALADVQQPEEVLFLLDGDETVVQHRRRVAEILRGNESTDIAIVDHEAKQNWGLLEQPERLQIHTIGSLALSLVAAAPVSSGCGAGVRLTDNPDAFYRTAARALLRTLDHDEQVAPNLETLLLHLDNDLVRAERLVAGMLRRRGDLQNCLKLGEPEANRSTLQTALEDAVVMTLSEVSGAIPDDVAAELVTILGYAARQLSIRGSDSTIATWRDVRRLPAADAAHLAQWRGLSKLLLDDEGNLRRNFGAEQGFPEPSEAQDDAERAKRVEMQSHIAILMARLEGLEYFDARLRAVSHVADVRYTHVQWTVLQSLLAVLPRVIQNLGSAFRALGEMDLTEVVQGATRALASGQAEIFGPRGLQHFIVDNMPELSFGGMKLVEGLTRSWTGKDNHSLYATGNPYASICRSDGAQPALFLKVLNSGLGQCALSMYTLDEQKRSGAAIVTWINQLFSHESDAVIAEGAMPFLAAKPQNENLGSVELHSVAGGHQAETQLIVKLLTDNPALLDGSIAVLLGDREGAASIIDALRKAGIPCSSDAVDLLGQRSVISDLHSLTRALCHLSDRVAWLTVLRAPWCGLTLQDLHRLSADSSQVAVWDLLIDEQRRSRLSEDGQQRLSRIKRVIAQTLAERGRRDLRRLVEGVWTALGGGVGIKSQFELDQTRDYFRMLEQIDDGGEPDSLEALDEAVERLCAGSDTDSHGGVFITTIRNARRRSFDTVLVAGVSTDISLPDDDDALRWLVRPDQFGKTQLLLAPVSGEGRGDAINHWVKSVQSSMHHNELRRLFYSGVTRADHNLHVIVSPPRDDDGWTTPPASSPLRAMWSELRPLLAAEPELAIDTAIDSYATPHSIRRLPSSWLLPEAPQPKVWQARETQARMTPEDAELLSDNARIIARVMKRTLSEMATHGPVDWAMRSLDGLENSFQQLFAMMGIDEKHVASEADRAGLAVRATLEDKRAQWLLSANYKNSRSPLRLSGWLDDSLVDAHIDRSFIDKDDVRWIVGYYFPELDGGSDASLCDAVVDAQRAKWNAYAGLARRFEHNPVKIGLYFPYSSSWHEWDPESG